MLAPDIKKPSAKKDWNTTFRSLFTRFFGPADSAPPITPEEVQFPEVYRLLISPQQAMHDFLSLAAMFETEDRKLQIRLDSGAASQFNAWRLAIYSPDYRDLDEVLPVLRNLELRVLDQTQFVLTVREQPLYLRDFRVQVTDAASQSSANVGASLSHALYALLSGEAEDDPLNGLVLKARLDWRQVDLLRSYCNYYLQICDRFDQRRVFAALLANAGVAELLYAYFAARFDPHPDLGGPTQRESEILPAIRDDLIGALERVTNLAEDRVLRDLFNIIDSTWRTNFFLPPKGPMRYISFKIGSLGVINMPSPRPFAEIYVHGRLMEGIHLRGAKVARGGVRWSNRLDDYRVEILDLMRTQMVKNAIIVPQGAKGGFVVKPPPSSSAGRSVSGPEAYALFIRGVLDLTDNLHGAKIVRPLELICYDDPDPYLVVAADKGTASFSDRANEIASEYGFWLDDAFATGGSNGFHHKQLGITARGAWICVKRHFWELGRNIDEQAISVVGVGGMEGDVFGNGMLLSNRIRLLGAFSANYIFLDPDPDAAASYHERRRLFETPGSSWADYNADVISPGGGVYRRDAKEILLARDVREWLGARSDSVDGDTLVRLLLAAPADLLWMGGVGAYVKASTESNEDVGDRVNDAARVDASEIRAIVVGEGANLGFTQKARIEFALRGGHIDTDAIDNSAGVNLSDHEVNLKILMSPRVNGGAVRATRGERNLLLHDLSSETCDKVLESSYRQCLSLSLEQRRSVANHVLFADVADLLEDAGALDRQSEFFPTRKEILARGEIGLTRPELSTLTAQSKLLLKRALIEAQGLVGADWAKSILAEYFPERARTRHAEGLSTHLLGREIIATETSNKLIDQAGVSILASIERLDARRIDRASRLYLTFDQVLQGDHWRRAIRQLDGQISTERQYEAYIKFEDTLAFLCRWAAERGLLLEPDPSTVVEWRKNLTEFLAYHGVSLELQTPAVGDRENHGLHFLSVLRDFPELVRLARSTRRGLTEIARIYDDFMQCLGLRQISKLISGVPTRDPWERRLQSSLEDQLRSIAARLACEELRTRTRNCDAFLRERGLDARVAKLQALRLELAASPPARLVSLAALTNELSSLVDALPVELDAA